jgi:hypothetical protein
MDRRIWFWMVASGLLPASAYPQGLQEWSKEANKPKKALEERVADLELRIHALANAMGTEVGPPAEKQEEWFTVQARLREFDLRLKFIEDGLKRD